MFEFLFVQSQGLDIQEVRTDRYGRTDGRDGELLEEITLLDPNVASPFFLHLWRHAPVSRHVLLHPSLLSSVCPIIAPPPPSVQSGAGRGEAPREEGCSLWRKCSLSHSLSLSLFFSFSHVPPLFHFLIKILSLPYVQNHTHAHTNTHSVPSHGKTLIQLSFLSGTHEHTRTHLHPNTHTRCEAPCGGESRGGLCAMSHLPPPPLNSSLAPAKKGIREKMRSAAWFNVLFSTPICSS